MQLWFDLLSFFQNHRGSLFIRLGTVPPWRAAIHTETGQSCRLERCAMRNIVYGRETTVPGEDVHSCSLFLYQHLWDTASEVSEATLHSDCVAAPRCACAGGRSCLHLSVLLCLTSIWSCWVGCIMGNRFAPVCTLPGKLQKRVCVQKVLA